MAAWACPTDRDTTDPGRLGESVSLVKKQMLGGNSCSPRVTSVNRECL